MTTPVEQPAKNTKWVWIGLGAAVLFCLCAVGAAILAMYGFGRELKKGVKTDSKSAAQAALKIVDGYDLPQGYQEKMAMDMTVYSMVVIGPDTLNANEPIIMLAQFSSFGTNTEQMKQQMRQSFEQQAGNRGSNMQLVETKTMTIRGEATEVDIYEGTDQYGNDLRQLITTFPGKNGTAMLMIMGDRANWDDNAIDTFVKSIR